MWAQADKVGDEGADWGALQKFEAGLKTQEGLDDAARAQAYLRFLEQRRGVHPNVAAIALINAGGILRDNLKQPDEALKLLDVGLAQLGNDPAGVLLLHAKAKTLSQHGRTAEVPTLIEPQIPLLLRAAQSGHGNLITNSALALREWALAQGAAPGDAKANASKVASTLQRVLIEAPVFLSDTQQGTGNWESGWMYERLVDALSSSGRPKEALNWARVAYECCAFEKESIERATRLLGRAWVSNDDFGAMRLFAKAQEDAEAAKTNPVRKVALPALSPAQRDVLQAQSKRLSEQAAGWDPEGSSARALISSLLLRGDKEARLLAIEVAKGLIKARPESPQGAQEMCRVIKAVDGHPQRANAFIAYMAGQGENPLPGVTRDIQAMPQAAPAAAAATG